MKNREIKFRAWDEDIKQMLPPVDLSVNKKYWKWLGVNDLKLMQFTGLLDKNGKEIYEGDIVEIPDYYAKKGIVEYSAPEFHVYDGDDGFTSFDWEEWEYFKVIGNIYENPNLLK